MAMILGQPGVAAATPARFRHGWLLIAVIALFTLFALLASASAVSPALTHGDRQAGAAQTLDVRVASSDSRATTTLPFASPAVQNPQEQAAAAPRLAGTRAPATETWQTEAGLLLATPAAKEPNASTAVAAATSEIASDRDTPGTVSVGSSARSVTLSPRAAALLQAMNARRSDHALPPLELSAAISVVALSRAQDMVANEYFAHISPSGDSWHTLIAAAGIRLGAGGENLARVSGNLERSVEVTITKLMESPTHRANILYARYSRVGVAAVTDDDGVTIFVAIFADERT